MLFQNNTNINTEYIVKEFLDTYYSRISILGINSITYLFKHNACCTLVYERISVGEIQGFSRTINNYQSIGYNGLILFYFKEKIEKLNFINVSPQWYSFGNGDILIITHGRVIAVNNDGFQHAPMNYSDTILLTNNNGKYEISIYYMKIN